MTQKKKRRNGDELPVWGPIEQHELHWEGGPMGATGKHGQKYHFDNQIATTIENPSWSHNVCVGDESIDANSMTNK